MAIAVARTHHAGIRTEEFRGMAARIREFMRYFTVITKYAQYGNRSQGRLAIPATIARAPDEHASHRSLWESQVY